MPWTELALGPGNWILLVLAGALFGMDAVSWPQVMISRPLVSATAGGWLLGDPSAGILVGAVLEIFALRHPPLGAARYPDTGPAGLVAGAAFAASGGHAPGALLVSVLAGWSLGWVGTVTVHIRRSFNERLIGDIEELAATPSLLEKRHRLAIWMDGLRGGVLVASFLVPTVLLVAVVAGVESSSAVGVAMTALVLGVASAAGSAARATAFGIRGWPLILVGGALGLLLLLVAAP